MTAVWAMLATAVGISGALFIAFVKGGNAKKGTDAVDTLDRVQKGRDAVSDSDDKSPPDVVRGNDEWWGKR